MNKSQILKICEVFHLGTTHNEAIPIGGGLIHHMWKINTTSGSFAIKELDAEIMKRPGIHECYIQSEKIAAILKSKKIPAETALMNNIAPLYEIDGSIVMVFPWVDGSILMLNQITPGHANKIGGIVAAIHAANITTLNLPQPEIHFISEQRWHSLIDKALINKLTWAAEANTNFSNLLTWSDAYQKAKQQLNKKLIISHRDIDPKNVIWRDSNSPVLIDWESAGLINATEEAITVAIEWAGMTETLFKKNIFSAIIDGYYNRGGKLDKSEINDALYGVIGNCLNWLEFNMSRSLESSNYDKDIQNLGIEETEMTFKKLRFLATNTDHLIKLLQK